MTKTSLRAFKAKDTRFVADWLKSKGLHKLCSVFEGIQEPECCLLNHIYIHSFRSIIKATEKFTGVGAFDHLNGPKMGHLNIFSASGGGNKNFPKIQMPGGLPGGDVEASI